MNHRVINGARLAHRPWWRALILLPCVLLGFLLMAASHRELSLKDDRGVVVSFAAPPERIVSLTPALSESVCALGACARIVGSDLYSNHPAELRHVPKVGAINDADVDAIVALKPDVVLMGYMPRLAERLEAKGLKVLLLEGGNLDDIERMLGVLGRMLGLPDPDAAWRSIDTRISQASQGVPPNARGLSFYYEFENSPFAASEASFIGEILTRLGVNNIVPASLGLFPRLSADYVPRADPQVMMLASRHAPTVAQRAGWKRLRAVRNQHICWLTDDEADVLWRPGPRLGEAAEILARCLRAVARGPIPLPSSPALPQT